MTDQNLMDSAALLEAYGAEPLALWHGSVTGLACGAPASVARRMVLTLQLPDGTDPDEMEGGAVTVVAADLDGVIDATLASLEEDGGLSFQPLLSDDTALSERALALAQWCQGFLYGLANTTRRDLLDSEELAEVLSDFAQISRAVRGSDDAEVAETAYVELVEFVRAGVLLSYEALRPERERWPEGEAAADNGGDGASAEDSLQ